MLSLLQYYKIGRFIFSLALLALFASAGLAQTKTNLMYVLAIYSMVAFARLLKVHEKIGHCDFFLDIIFLSAIIFAGADAYPYLTFLYLFPIFFSAVMTRSKMTFIFPLSSLFFYTIIAVANRPIGELFLNSSLHLLSFAVIALAGENLKARMDKQERYIKDLEEERIRMKSYERLFNISADLAHELRNPLASISAVAQFLKEGKNYKEFIDVLDFETKRLSDLLNDFLFFSRPSDAPIEEINFVEMLNSVIAYQKGGKDVQLNAPEKVSIITNRIFLEVAVNNVIKNAFEAARSLVKITLTEHHPMAKAIEGAAIGEFASLVIEDDGAGIDEGIRQRIFEPFFTTKHGGTGLGLSIAHRIITSLGGSISLDSSYVKGACFKIILPLKQADVKDNI
ncbi:MAG: HAMP domain-containing histidine kinase [Nitrospirae bacterium]|nr:HAMP domain-containing histidine kinase [Nitrospirota bacterium]